MQRSVVNAPIMCKKGYSPGLFEMSSFFYKKYTIFIFLQKVLETAAKQLICHEICKIKYKSKEWGKNKLYENRKLQMESL